MMSHMPRGPWSAALRLLLLVCVVSVLVGCQSAPEPFAVYIGADESSERFSEETPYSNVRGTRMIYLEAEPLLTTAHLAQVWRQPTAEGSLFIELTSEGQGVLERAASRYVENRIVIVLDGKALAAPFAMDPLLSLGLNPNLMAKGDDETMQRILDRFNEITGGAER